MHDHVASAAKLWGDGKHNLVVQELEAEDLDSQLLEPAPVPATRVPARAQPAAAAGERYPAVPAQSARPAARPKQKTAEELELEALEAEMAA